MEAADYLRFARWLAQDPGPLEFRSAALRSSISRAYYGAYHLVCGFLRSFGCIIERGGRGHLDVHTWLNAAGARDLAYLSSVLSKLQEVRLAADYSLADVAVETAEAATGAVSQAQEIASVLDEVAGNQRLCSSIRTNLQRETRKRRA